MVHGASGYEHSVGVEGEADDLHLMALESVVALASVGVPNLGCSVEGTSHDLVTIA